MWGLLEQWRKPILSFATKLRPKLVLEIGLRRGIVDTYLTGGLWRLVMVTPLSFHLQHVSPSVL